MAVFFQVVAYFEAGDKRAKDLTSKYTVGENWPFRETLTAYVDGSR